MEERGAILMYKGLIGVVTSCLLMITTPTFADGVPPQTTGELYSACLPIAGRNSFNLSDMPLFNAGYCLGITHARSSEMGMNCWAEDKDHPLRAATLGVSPAALIQAFVNYARDNPQDWGMPMLGGLAQAFKLYFPCRL